MTCNFLSFVYLKKNLQQKIFSNLTHIFFDYSLVQNYKTTSYYNSATINFADFSLWYVLIGTLTYLKISEHN